MNGTAKETIHAGGIEIGIYTSDFNDEFISLTDIAKYKSIDPRITIHNWLRSRDIVEFLGLWETLHNPRFNRIEFDTFKKDAGTNAFVFSIKKWTEQLNAVGIVSTAGRSGGTYAYSDIAFEFASWISPDFKLYIIKDYKRLKTEENSRLSLNWNLNREISRLNYKIHTDAIKENLILPELTESQRSAVYASEADMLNVILFGKTAQQWRKDTGKNNATIRDCANLYQLLILANMESYNAILIKQNKTQTERMSLLRELAIQQVRTLKSISLKNLPNPT